MNQGEKCTGKIAELPFNRSLGTDELSERNRKLSEENRNSMIFNTMMTNLDDVLMLEHQC